MLEMLRDLVAHKGHANAALLTAIRQNPTAASDPELWELPHHILLANRFWLLTVLGLLFAEAVPKNGELTISGNTGVLGFAIRGNRGAAYFEREAGEWRVTNGPMMFPSDPDPANETRIEGIDILNHPVGKLALQYLDLVHAGRIEDAKKLATADVQAKWKNEPSREKGDTLAYLRKTLPTRTVVTEGLKARKNFNAVFIIEDDRLATLNFMVSSQKPAGANTTNYTTSSTNIGFEKEGGEWKLAQ